MDVVELRIASIVIGWTMIGQIEVGYANAGAVLVARSTYDQGGLL